ncbi:MAG TPA: carboxypeptidase-like regulatory domain-containing protein [Gemmataceae bacterium]|nr:carboxypeptidase-like regulatory domain-containing protein [Gemmataceae bacterium]
MRQFVAVSLVVLLLAGCGSKRSSGGVVIGKITYKGQPVNGATLQLYSVDGASNITIPVTQEGTFRTSDVPPGEYKVVVQPGGSSGVPSLKGMDPAKAAEAKQKLAGMQQTKPTIPFPDKYRSHLKTDLKPTIVKGEQTLNLELKD